MLIFEVISKLLITNYLRAKLQGLTPFSLGVGLNKIKFTFTYHFPNTISTFTGKITLFTVVKSVYLCMLLIISGANFFSQRCFNGTFSILQRFEETLCHAFYYIHLSYRSLFSVKYCLQLSVFYW